MFLLTLVNMYPPEYLRCKGLPSAFDCTDFAQTDQLFGTVRQEYVHPLILLHYFIKAFSTLGLCPRKWSAWQCCETPIDQVPFILNGRAMNAGSFGALPTPASMPSLTVLARPAAPLGPSDSGNWQSIH